MAEIEALSQEASAAIDSQLNPFSLHHSFSSTTVLVSQSLIGAANFISWKRAILTALSGKNKEGFLSGDVKKPVNPKLLTSWKCNNDMLASWIINSVSKDIAASIVYNGNVKDVWDELCERFKESNGPRIFQLRKELVTTAQGSMTVEVYFTKIKTIWQELADFRPDNDCSCGKLKPLLDYLESEYVMVFLMGLNESFSTLRTQILLLDPLPSINKVFSLVVQEERQRIAGFIPQADPIALLATETIKSTVSSNRRKDSTRPVCTHCGKLGHTVDKCYKIHGYPPGYRTRNISAPSSENKTAASSNFVSQGGQSNFFSSLNSVQCSQLMELLNSHMQTTKPESANVTAHVTGQDNFEEDWQG